MNKPPKRLLDQVRDQIRLRHYSIRTEQAYVSWIKRFILFHDKKHPNEMGKQEMEFSSLQTLNNIMCFSLGLDRFRGLLPTGYSEGQIMF